MKRKELFEPPVVTVIDLRMSGTILAASMRSSVETEGQEYHELDYFDQSSPNYVNQGWD